MSDGTGGEVPRLLPGSWEEDSTGQVRLLGTRCGQCATLTFPPASACPHCWEHHDLASEVLPEPGVVHSFSVVHVPEDGIEAPYTIGWVDFPGGIRVCGRIRGPDVAVGDPVRVIAGLIRDRGENSLRGWMFEHD